MNLNNVEINNDDYYKTCLFLENDIDLWDKHFATFKKNIVEG